MTELKFQLDGEKTRFEAAMVKLEEQINKATLFDDFDKWDRASSTVIELNEAVEAAKATVASFNKRERRFKVDVSGAKVDVRLG